MDPVVNKLTTTLPDSQEPDAGGQPTKSGPSRFDKISSQLKDASGKASSPDMSVSPSNSTAASNGAQAVDRTQNAAMPVPDRVHQNLTASQHHLAQLKERIEATPGMNSMQGIQNRLTSIEHQYTRLDAAAKTLPPNASPQQWLSLQQQVYSMNENIGVLSKMVGQAASGVKTLLQTQV